MLGRVKLGTLGLIAGYGAVATIGAGLYLKYKLQEKVKQRPFVKEAMKKLRTYKPAVELLGEPIKAGNIDVGDEISNKIQGNNAQLVVPVKGSKSKGHLHIWATAEENNSTGTGSVKGDFSVSRLELGFEEDPTRRLVVFKT